MSKGWLGKDVLWEVALAAGEPKGITTGRPFRRRATTVRLDMVRDLILKEEKTLKQLSIFDKIFKKQGKPTEELDGFVLRIEDSEK